MNEQQLQQILTIQQAIAAAATAAVINSLLNPQQAAAGLPNAAGLPTDQTGADNGQLQAESISRQTSPHLSSSSPANQIDSNNRIQELLLQLQQQAAAGAVSPATAATAAALNLNLNNQQLQSPQAQNLGIGSPMSQSPINSRLLGPAQAAGICTDLSSSPRLGAATSSNIQLSNQSPGKKSKRHQQPLSQQHQQQFSHQQQNRSSYNEATGKPPQSHSTPKNHSSISNLNSSRSNSSTSNANNSNNTSSSAFLANNVSLPRKLVRGQDVWLGRGAEQTRQILKCMWCGQSFRTLAEMTQHMKVTQHYTNIISQEQITSWRQPDSGSESSSIKHGKQSAHSKSIEDNLDDSNSERFNESDREDSTSNDDDFAPIQNRVRSKSIEQRSAISKQRETLPPVTNNSGGKELTKQITSPNNRQTVKSAQHLAPTAKPLTRSRRREDDGGDLSSPPPLKSSVRSIKEGQSSPVNSSSSQQQATNEVRRPGTNSPQESDDSSHHLKEDLKLEDANSPRDCTRNTICDDKPTATPQDSPERAMNLKTSDSEDEVRPQSQSDESNHSTSVPEDKNTDGNSVKSEQDDTMMTNKGEASKDIEQPDGEQEDGAVPESTDAEGDQMRNRAESPASGDENDQSESENNRASSKSRDRRADGEPEDGSDTNGRRKRSKVDSGAFMGLASNAGSKQAGTPNGQKNEIDPGDPLSALETMVEKSFDPRLRPGMAGGGILQRLGIDEEVCPPWQHINYANWYAAAAYGHPMAAALLAAGLNLQNGIKLSKNVSSKKSDD